MSPWFRRKRKQATEEQAAQQAPAPAEQPQTELSTADAAADSAAADASTDPARKRRRGSRGGRGRKKPGAEGEAKSEPTSEQPARRERSRTSSEGGQRSQGSQRQEAQREGQRSQRQERRANQQGNRRRVPQKRAPLPKAKRELLISVDVGEQRVAIVEDDRVAEVYLERPERRSIAGNIYLGTVDNVLPGMEAAFVEIGLEKNGFLYVDEIVVPELEGKRHGKKITDLIARGQQILVQAVKDPMKTKGARLTTEISLPGRFLVFVPQGEGLGVSRRLDDGERTRLKEIIKGLDVKEGGVIVRTAAEGASAEDVERDLVFLQRLWKTIQARAKTAKAPSLVYQEAELPLRIVRDLFAGDFESAQIDHERTYKRIVGYLKKTSPHMLERVHRYKEKTPLFEGTGVDAEIRSTLNRRVELPSGGYLIFDYAEAFTVIDVNTGRFVGGRGKSSNARLEDTITKNNLEAVTEVVRQLRLRDIGGIIVIDYIDMANPKNRATVEEALRTELERDRTKTYVVEISPLGLVEMTRQNVTDGPREILTEKCPTCAATGVVVSAESRAVEVERKLRKHVAASKAEAFVVELHSDVAAILIGPNGERLEELEKETGKRFAFKTKKSFRLDRFAILSEAKASAVEGLAPRVESPAKAVPAPARPRTRSRKAAAPVEAVVALDETVLEDAEEDEAAPVQAEGPSAGGDEPVETPKKKTRRGSRGGRGRKKKAAVVVAEHGEAAPEDGQPPDEPVEAVAEPEEPSPNGDAPAEEKPKKKTRRGTRGGRRRKKKPAADGAAEAATEPIATAEDAG